MRSPSVSRLYLQVPDGTDAGAWDDDEIWAELERRFETADGWRLRHGPITQKSVTPMRSFVCAGGAFDRGGRCLERAARRLDRGELFELVRVPPDRQVQFGIGRMQIRSPLRAVGDSLHLHGAEPRGQQPLVTRLGGAPHHLVGPGDLQQALLALRMLGWLCS
jgi:hypothetical protein